ncbi:unnamed protein product [Darwinula stevensoni]|uniref:Serine-threonine/tyrosine-protein kinase catalytic domain-containing protein n=1 Tax=Darwinula stevensoni TaxID=69355 RepID=A0A7R9AE72_9CRUS|nr:unnamed protein product [Darwinula stevensoni]CAG0902049.1 unnamed protein product [Darwinula stevensoni]
MRYTQSVRHTTDNVTQHRIRPLGKSGISVISASGISFVALLVCSISYYRFRKEKAQNIALNDKDTKEFLEGQPGSLNSAMGLSEQAHLLPFDVQWDFPPEKLKLGKLLGSGEFGYVLKAVAVGIRPPEPETTVAVKKRKPHSSLENYQTLMMEVKIMSHLGMHLNVDGDGIILGYLDSLSDDLGCLGDVVSRGSGEGVREASVQGELETIPVGPREVRSCPGSSGGFLQKEVDRHDDG